MSVQIAIPKHVPLKSLHPVHALSPKLKEVHLKMPNVLPVVTAMVKLDYAPAFLATGGMIALRKLSWFKCISTFRSTMPLNRYRYNYKLD